jgi:hypothetical protein
MTDKTKRIPLQEAVDIVDAMDLPDGARDAMIGEMAGIDSCDVPLEELRLSQPNHPALEGRRKRRRSR